MCPARPIRKTTGSKPKSDESGRWTHREPSYSTRPVTGLLLAALCSFTQAQTPPPKESVVVTGTYQPIPLDEADRAVRVLAEDDAARILSNTFFDLLRTDPSLDVRGRTPNGVQTDLSIRGANFGQTLVLLDGLRLNDAQSGHHNLDVPVPLTAWIGWRS